MRFTGLIALAMLASPAHAELRELCPSRPGLGTPPCTVDQGHAIVEVGLADWTIETDAEQRTDTLLLGQTLVRVGLDDRTEVQVGWTPYGRVRTRDRPSGVVTRSGEYGDVIIGFKRSLAGPDGPIALQPFVTLPVGGTAIGGGDWGAGIIVPIAFKLGSGAELALSPQVDAAVNTSGSGRHVAYGSVIGISAPIGKGLTGNVELQATRDNDPSGATTLALASMSLAWVTDRDTQFDIGGVAGLNRDSHDVQLYIGISRRF